MITGENKIVQLTAVANSTASIPAGHKIIGMTIENTTGNAVTGGIRIGTTDGGVDVAVAIAVAGNAVIGIPDATILKTYFSSSLAQTLYVQTVTLWNSASLSINILLARVQ